MNKRFFLINTILLLIISLAGCNRSELLLQNERGNALGTTYSILYFDQNDSPKITSSLDSIFKVVNHSLSTYIPTSDISRINKGEKVVVDHMFQEVFQLSDEINKSSKGYFDPTVGILVNAWGFGPKKSIPNMDAKKVDSLMQFVGWRHVELNTQNQIEKTNPNVYLDFNAIAKGYCIDRIAAFMDQGDYSDYLIEVGGELVAKGIHQLKKSPWTVGIDDPNQKESRDLIALLNLKNQAMATSGNYRKFKTDSLTGKKYVHTIDPHTGYTKPSNILSVSVLAENCAIADAWATTFMAMPLEEAKDLVADLNLEVYIIYLTATNQMQIFKTGGFERLILD